MGSLGAAGNGGIWGMGPFHDNFGRRRNKKRDSNKRESKSNNSVDAGGVGGGGYQFPLQQAATSSALCLTGDTIAQLRHRWVKNKDTLSGSQDFKVIILSLSLSLSEKDVMHAQNELSWKCYGLFDCVRNQFPLPFMLNLFWSFWQLRICVFLLCFGFWGFAKNTDFHWICFICSSSWTILRWNENCKFENW